MHEVNGWAQFSFPLVDPAWGINILFESKHNKYGIEFEKHPLHTVFLRLGNFL